MSIAFVARVGVCNDRGTSALLKKCPVLPVSAIVLMMVEGGPNKLVFVVANAKLLLYFLLCLLLFVLGSPLPYLDSVGVGLFFRAGRVKICTSLR